MALLPQPRVQLYPKDPYGRAGVNHPTLDLDRGLKVEALSPREVHKLVLLRRKSCSISAGPLYVLSVDLLEGLAVILCRVTVRYKVHVVHKAYY